MDAHVPAETMTSAMFTALLEQLAAALTAGDHAAAAGCFAEDVRYRDPMRMSIDGRERLRQAFEGEIIAQRLIWRRIVFDEAKQQGAAEFTAHGMSRFHGIVTIAVDDQRITRWHALQHVSDFDWHDFWGTAVGKHSE
ncbi:MAG TPA: nuclear transport factor 2 family protein [Vicinamibacterales bacterium]|nr:nuclear transport factor 2 family protein [Vicinamibacterales bacterium]